MREVKTQLAELAERAWKGEQIIIAKAGKPYLDLVPHRKKNPPRKRGLLKGRIEIAPDFDDIDHALIDEFEAN